MKVGIYDIETSGLDASMGIILAVVVATYNPDAKTYTGEIKTFRADDYPAWKKNRVYIKPLIRDLLKYLDDFDILVAHNGEGFDKRFINTVALKYRLKPLPRNKKTVDPVILARRYLRFGRNNLNHIIHTLKVKTLKTPLDVAVWQAAVFNGDRRAMDKVVKHCRHDVLSLAEVYHRFRPLIERVDSKGSHG